MSRLSDVEVDGLTFDACFDSGNATRVERVDDDEYALWTAGDCEGTENERRWTTWFSFSVRGEALSAQRMLAFNIYNMNPQGKLFRQDMRPVYRVLPSKPHWQRLPLQTTHTGTKEEDNFVLRFRHKCECGPDETLFFAFCFPLSYCEQIARLAWLDALFGLRPRPSHPSPALTDAAVWTAAGGSTPRYSADTPVTTAAARLRRSAMAEAAGARPLLLYRRRRRQKTPHNGIGVDLDELSFAAKKLHVNPRLPLATPVVVPRTWAAVGRRRGVSAKLVPYAVSACCVPPPPAVLDAAVVAAASSADARPRRAFNRSRMRR